MPYRLQLIANFLEALALGVVNILLLISWMNIIAIIPLLLSSVYSIAKIKRDINEYHNGSWKRYFMFLIGKSKKN